MTMNRTGGDDNKWIVLLVIGLVCLLLLIIVFIFGTSNDEKEKDYYNEPATYGIIVDDEFNSVYNEVPKQSSVSQRGFYLRFSDGLITIYEEDGTFYDYAQINTDSLPDDVLGDLKMGMSIYGEDSLYEFLQAYTS